MPDNFIEEYLDFDMDEEELVDLGNLDDLNLSLENSLTQVVDMPANR